MKDTLSCKVCGKKVEVRNYKIDDKKEYTCAKCRIN